MNTRQRYAKKRLKFLEHSVVEEEEEENSYSAISLFYN